jgi:hypothetical protein
MTAFHAAFLAERAACRAVIRWRALYSRCRPRMAALAVAAGSRLHYRLKDYVHAAEDAHEGAVARLEATWDALSRRLTPAAVLTDADAFLCDTDRAGAAVLFADLIAQGIADNPDWYDRERHDARLIVDDILLRRVRLPI